MRVRSVVAFTFGFILAAILVGQGVAQSKSTAGAKSEAPVFIPASDLKWADLNPTGAPGVKIADVWGDHAKGGYGAFLRFPAGFLSPLHTHTHTIKIVVISGTYTQAPEGKSAARLGKGSYAFQPGGNYKHISGCDKASACVLFIESTGPFDLLPVGGGAAK